MFINEWTIDKKIREDRYGDLIRIYRDTEGDRKYSALRILSFPASEEEYLTAKSTVIAEEELDEYFYEMVERAEAECRVMSTLKNNGNIVGYDEYAIVENTDSFGWKVYIRIELLKPFLTYVNEHPMTEEDVIRFGLDLSHALEGCRQFEIVHRDVRPENIYVTDDGHFKLGGFDIAHEREKVASDRKIKKPGAYMAPEQVGGKNYSYPADMYSLGLIMYRYLNDDRLPFLPPRPASISYFDREEAMRKLMEGRPLPDPVNGSDALISIVKRACAYRPGNRYDSPSDMHGELEKLISNQRPSEAVKPDLKNRRKTLIVVDMQNDFIDGSLGTKEAVSILPAVKAKIHEYINQGDEVIYTRDTHQSNYLQTNEGRHLPVIHCIEGSKGHEIAPGIYVDGCEIIDKPIFGHTGWAGRSFREVELIGLRTDICVVTNAILIKTLYPEINISVDPDCCAGVTPESHKAALLTMKMCQIDISN